MTKYCSSGSSLFVLLPKEIIINEIVFNLNELEVASLFHTCHFFQKLIETKPKITSKTIKKSNVKLPLFKWAFEYMGLSFDPNSILMNLSFNNNIPIIDFITSPQYKKYDRSLNWNLLLLGAAKSGHIEPLDWIITKFNFFIADKFNSMVIKTATKHNKIQILEWINNHLQPETANRTFWTRFNCDKAIESGHIDTVSWMAKNGAILNHQSCLIPILKGDLKMLKFLTTDYALRVDHGAVQLAAQTGNLEILKWLKENQYPWDNFTCKCAINNNHFELLKWMINNGCPWDTNDDYHALCGIAAEKGQLNWIQWIISNGGHWDNVTCGGAVKAGRIDILKWVRENGCPWGYSTCSNAAVSGRLDILQWARENGCPWDNETFSGAVYNGDIIMLQWLKENNCPWGDETTAMAAQQGNLQILEWLINNGCPWCKSTCYTAASNGNLNVIKWSVSNGCPWAHETSLAAAGKGHLKIIQWILENGYSCHEQTCLTASIEHYHIIKWMFENGHHDLIKNAFLDSTLMNLAFNGQIDILKLAMKMDYINQENSEKISAIASSTGHISILKWLLDNNFKLNKECSNLATKNGYYDVKIWIQQLTNH